MLLTQRRIALLHVCLALMQACWFTPFLLLVNAPVGGMWQALGAVFVALVAWMLILELLSRLLESPAYEVASLTLLLITSILGVRLLLYRGGAPWEVSWLGRAISNSLNFDEGLPPGVIIIAANLFLWQRAANATSRDLTFFGVGMSFRVGMLLLMLGGGVYAVLRGGQLVSFLWVYFAAGLLAVSLARIGEKAVETQSAGSILPARRLSQVLAAVGVTLGVGMLASLAYTPDGVRRFLRLFAPLWDLVRPALLALLIVLGRILDPVLVWLEQVISNMLGQPSAPEATTAAPGSPGTVSPFENLPGWPFDLARSVFGLIVLVGAAVGLLVFLLLYLERVGRESARVEGEEEGRDPGTFGRSIVGHGWSRLRDAWRLARRVGLGRHLLAAISVQNIYANLTRIAGQRGHARLPAQPPDDYLPVLERVFPGQLHALERVTDAYMRVHYGDHRVPMEELARLREDYLRIRAAEKDAS